MDKIDVTQNARQAAFDAYLTCYESVPNDLWLQALLNGKHDGDEMAQAFARFERDILATRTDATPVAWMPKESAPKDGTPFLAIVDGEEYPITLRWNAYDAAAQEEIGEDGYFHYADEALAEIDPDALQRFSEGFVWWPLPAASDHIEEPRAMVPATDVAALVEADRNTDTRGYIVGNSDRTKWRKWLNGDCIWTDDPREATRFFFRSDANAVHHEDEDAWCIVELRQAWEAGR